MIRIHLAGGGHHIMSTFNNPEGKGGTGPREAYFQALMDHAADAIFISDPADDGRILDVNRTACEMLQYSREELLAMRLADIDVEVEPRDHKNRIWNKISNERSVTFVGVQRRKDGSTLHVEVHATSIEIDGKKRLLGVSRDITERREAERALLDSERRFRSLVERFADPIFVHDLDGRLIMVNHAACRSTGYTEEELLGMCVADVDTADVDRDMIGDLTDKARRGEDVTVNQEHRCKNGDRFPVEVRLNLLEMDGREVVLAVARDITYRKVAEDRLQQSESHLAYAQNAANLGSYKWDMVEGPVTWSEEMFHIFGMDPLTDPPDFAEFIELVHPDDRHLMSEEVFADNIRRKLFDMEFRAIDQVTGEIKHIYHRGSFSYDESGRPVEALGTIQDITERKRAEEALRESERRFRLAAKASTDLIYQWNVETGDLKWLGDIDGALGYEQGEIPHTLEGWTNLLHPEDRERTLSDLSKYSARKEPAHIEYRIRCKDGTWRYWLDNLAPLVDGTGRSVVWIGGCKDVTEQRRAEAEIARAQQLLLEQQRTETERVAADLAKAREQLVRQTRLATVGQMAASIAHELRNPLGAARNSAYFLKRYATKPDAEFLEHLRIIDDEIRVAGGIITDLLDVARAKPPEKKDLALGEIVHEALEKLRLPDGIMCFLTADPDPFVLNADAGQLRQVFQNLLANAAQAVGLEGEIRIHAEREAGSSVITVRDSGAGVPEGDVERIFEPLFSTRPKGTGLGLTICRDIIERHGGTIELTHAGPGAEFRLRLPVTAP